MRDRWAPNPDYTPPEDAQWAFDVDEACRQFHDWLTDLVHPHGDACEDPACKAEELGDL